MLAAGDKCIYRDDCCNMPEFGIIVSVDGDGEGRVLFGPFVCEDSSKWVRKECVTKVESVSDGTMVWSSEVSFAWILKSRYHAIAGKVCFGLPLYQ